MIAKKLTEILGGGDLLDNSVHEVREGFFRSPHKRCVSVKPPSRRAKEELWELIQKASKLQVDSTSLVLTGNGTEYEHNTSDRFLRASGTDLMSCSLECGNLVGSVKSGSQTLTVSSRFGDEFLKSLISDSDGFVPVQDQGGADRGNLDWLLVYLFLARLKQALRMGLPKAYESREGRFSLVRGRLDPLDAELNSAVARYQCRYREQRSDNLTTHLIARALRQIVDGRRHPPYHFTAEALELNRHFQRATAGNRYSIRQLLEARNVSNPYFADYEPVVKLSKRILRGELGGFGVRDEMDALVFDVSMLFEYFVRKLLKRHGAVFHDKGSRRWSIPSGLAEGYTERRLYPDFIFNHDGGTYVFDAKYKSFDFRYGVKREDLFQLHTYVGRVSSDLKVEGCGLIYPIQKSRWASSDLKGLEKITSSRVSIGGKTLGFHVAFLLVPDEMETGEKDRPKGFRERFEQEAKSFASGLLRSVASFRSQNSANFYGHQPSADQR